MRYCANCNNGKVRVVHCPGARKTTKIEAKVMIRKWDSRFGVRHACFAILCKCYVKINK